MTSRDVRKLDDEQERARVIAEATSGDDRAASLLFMWAQWNKIRKLKKPAREKTLLLGELLNFMSANVKLEFTYGREESIR